MTKTRNLADLGGGFIQAGTGAVQRTVESKLQDVVSVKDFIPEGTDTATADCTAWIQKAVEACETSGKALFFPAGNYRITSPLRTGRLGGLSIVGEHQYASTLILEGEGKNCIEHDYNPVTVTVAGTTATVTSTHPHGFSSGLIDYGNRGPLYRLPGAFLGAKTITVTGANTFTFTVAGGTTTPASQTGLIHPSYYRYLWITDLRIATSKTNMAGSAIIAALRGDGGPTKVVRLDRVRTGGWGAIPGYDEHWSNAVTIYQPTAVLITDCDFYHSGYYVPDETSNGIILECCSANDPTAGGSLDGAYGILIERTQINYWYQCVSLRSNAQYANDTAEIHGLEGILLSNVWGAGHRGVVHTSNIASALIDADYPIALEIYIRNCSFEVSGAALSLSRARSLTLADAVNLLNGGEKGNVAGTSLTPEAGVILDRCAGAKLDGMNLTVFFAMGDSGTPWVGQKKPAVVQLTDCEAVVIDKCVMTIPENDVVTGISIDADCVDVAELTTTFERYDNPATVPFATIAGGATDCYSCTYVRYNGNTGSTRVNVDDDGNVTLTGQQVITTDGSSQATVTLPAGVFSSVDETIMAQLNDADTADAIGYHVPVYVQGTATPTQFDVRYDSLLSTVHRIAYTVTGKA